MSYILDALRRAEAERERGGVPGLHTQVAPPPGSPTLLSARRRASLATLTLIALGAVAAGLWAWRAPVAIPVADPAPLTQATPPAAPLPDVPLATTSVAAAQVARVVVAKPATAPTPAVKAAEAGGNPVANIPLLGELPEDVRRQIPALAITGAVYSENAAQRLLLLNGQVLSQGSLAATDVTVERIGATQSEFSFRGTRFRIAH